MARYKKIHVPDVKDIPKEDPKPTEEKPKSIVEPSTSVPVKHILARDINHNMKKGMEISDQEYGRLMAAGFGAWFE